jgi:hypothetical protein
MLLFLLDPVCLILRGSLSTSFPREYTPGSKILYIGLVGLVGRVGRVGRESVERVERVEREGASSARAREPAERVPDKTDAPVWRPPT